MPPVTNFAAIMAGAIAKIEYAPWVTNYGATVFTDLGALKNIKDEEAIESTPFDADNVIGDIDELDQKYTKAIHATMMQMDPRTKVQMWGKLAADVVVVPFASPTKGTVKYGFGVPKARTPYTVRLTVEPLSLVLGLPTALTDVYIRYIVTIAKAKFTVKNSTDITKKGVSLKDIVLKAFVDDSVNLTTYPDGAMWKEEFQTEGT